MIVELDGEEVDGLGQLLAVLRDRDPGDEVTVGFVRDGEAQTAEVTLAELPDDVAAPSDPGGLP